MSHRAPYAQDPHSYFGNDPHVIEALRACARYDGALYRPQPYERDPKTNAILRQIGYREPLHADGSYLFDTQTGHAMVVPAAHVRAYLEEHPRPAPVQAPAGKAEKPAQPAAK